MVMSIVRKIREISTIAFTALIAFGPLSASAQSDEKQSCDSSSLQAVITKGYDAAHRADWGTVLAAALTLNFSSGICKEPDKAYTSALYGDFFGAIGFRHRHYRKKADELLADGRGAARRSVEQGEMPELTRKMLRRFDALAAHPMDIPG